MNYIYKKRILKTHFKLKKKKGVYTCVATDLQLIHVKPNPGLTTTVHFFITEFWCMEVKFGVLSIHFLPDKFKKDIRNIYLYWETPVVKRLQTKFCKSFYVFLKGKRCSTKSNTFCCVVWAYYRKISSIIHNILSSMLTD